MSTERDKVLEGAALLQLLDPSERDKVRRLLRERSCAFGEVVVSEGSPAEAFYLVESGRLRVVKQGQGGEEVMLNVLTRGDAFGEMALLDGGAHTATVRCSTDAKLLVLDGRDFQALLAETPRLVQHLAILKRQRTLHNFLRQFSKLGNLPLPALRSFLEQLAEVTCPKGRLIVREGDPPGPMYVIREGKMRVFVTGQGRERNLGFLRAGDFFGELSVLRGAPRAASVEAITDCGLLALSPEVLGALNAEYPEFKAVMDERAAQYNAKQEARIPLDFSEELLPADASVANKVEIGTAETLAEDAPVEAREAEDPFVDERGLFRKGNKRIRRIPVVQQIDEMDCGAASVAMICRHFGRREPLSSIRRLVHVSSDGTSLRAICSAAGRLGLAAQAVKASHRNLDRMPLPAIVHWEGNHWMVLFDVQADYVRVADPGMGVRKIGRLEFDEKWSGYAALFDRTEAFQPSREEKGASLSWLAQFFRPYRPLLVKVFVLAVVSSLLEMILPVFTQVVVDRVVVAKDISLLRLAGFGMIGALLCMAASNVLQRYMLSVAAVKIDTAILDFLTRTLLDLPMSYFSTRRTGDIQRRLAGAREVREFLVQSGIGGALGIVQLIVILGFMGYYSPRLLFVFLLTVPAYAGLMVFAARVLKPILALLEETYGKYSSRQIDAIKGIEAVKSAAAEPALRDQMLLEFSSLADRQFRGNFAVMAYEIGVDLTALLAQALFLWVGALMVMRGEFSLGRFVAFNALVAIAYGPVVRLLGLWDQIQKSGVLLNRLADVFENEPEQGRDHSNLKPVRTLEGRIRFENVGFQYGGPESPKIIQGISLDVPPGTIVAVVGRSGSGKSTMIKCLSGLLQPTEGTILYDGIDMQTLRFRDLRRQIGTVLQESYLFDDTIARNVALGDPQLDMERVAWACRTANAHDFVSRLPLGYETMVGESGLALSGGQQQRIAIARAIYSNPPVLIFDEATSSLDAESEQIIQANLARLFMGRTTFVIAHRLSTIRNADVIVVLDKGRIVEQGTHDALMTSRGLYFYLCSQQLAL
jgi:HlyB family type I secretion system ABC transporter